jgi:hypothetical protein
VDASPYGSRMMAKVFDSRSGSHSGYLGGKTDAEADSAVMRRGTVAFNSSLRTLILLHPCDPVFVSSRW